MEHLLQKQQEEIHKLFSILKLEGVVEVLAPLIIQKQVEWYKPYQVYWWQWWSQSLWSIPLPDPALKSFSSYHTASPLFPPSESGKICCLGCNKTGHLLQQCKYNYHWNYVFDRYVAISYGELKRTYYHPSNDADIHPELKKTRKSSA